MNLPVPVEVAIEAAALQHGVSPYALLVKTNLAEIVAARRDVFRALHSDGFSSNWIAKWFGMTHSNVLHHLKTAGVSQPANDERIIPAQIKPKQETPCCDRCGYRGKSSDLEPEGLHFICHDKVSCQDRFEDYLAFKELVAKGFREKYELLAARNTR